LLADTAYGEDVGSARPIKARSSSSWFQEGVSKKETSGRLKKIKRPLWPPPKPKEAEEAEDSQDEPEKPHKLANRLRERRASLRPAQWARKPTMALICSRNQGAEDAGNSARAEKAVDRAALLA
jgi:hypothetical protein